jgi:hypothetical protein
MHITSTKNSVDLKELTDDMSFWQQRYFDTLALDEERIAPR